jgi:hypothetical protein
MSDESDSWLENALGVDVSMYVGGVTIEPTGGPEQYATGVEIDPAESGGPTYYATGEDVDPAGVDAGNFSSYLTGVTNDMNAGGAPYATGAAIAEDKIPYVLGETAIEVDDETQAEYGGSNDGQPGGSSENGGNAPAPTGKPIISVKADGDDFKVTGSGFTPNANVTIRGRQYGDGWANEKYYPVHSDQDGKIDCKVPGGYVCRAPGAIRFSGTNGHGNKEDFSRVLWSDDVEAVCVIPKSKKDEDDDNDEPDSPEDHEGKIHGMLKTAYGQMGWKIKYWLTDTTTRKRLKLLNGDKYKVDEIIEFYCECMGQPDHGRVHVEHASDETGTVRQDGGTYIVKHGEVTNMQ